jgi:hypothetical protein
LPSLRAAEKMGLVIQDDGRYSLSQEGHKLCADNPTGIAPLSLFYGEKEHHCWSLLDQSVIQGLPAFELAHKKEAFGWLKENPRIRALYDQRSSAVAAMAAKAIARTYSFPAVGVVADIGGGSGHVLGEVLQIYPHLSGILFDLPDTVDQAKGFLAKDEGVFSRVIFKCGSFFDDLFAVEAEVYILKSVLHDWSDEECHVILRNCCKSMKSETARILVCERVLAPGVKDCSVDDIMMDINMLAYLKGKERSEREYVALLQDAGFEHVRTHTTGSSFSIIEATRKFY